MSTDDYIILYCTQDELIELYKYYKRSRKMLDTTRRQKQVRHGLKVLVDPTALVRGTVDKTIVDSECEISEHRIKPYKITDERRAQFDILTARAKRQTSSTTSTPSSTTASSTITPPDISSLNLS